MPLFLEQCAYDAIHANINMLDIQDSDLTKQEIENLEEIKKDCNAHIDTENICPIHRKQLHRPN